MTDTQEIEAAEKSLKKQNGKRSLREKLDGKKQMIVLWTTVLGLFSTTGIPKIIELFENKPSVEQVQTMIAYQTEKLSASQNATIDALKQLDEELDRTRDCLDRFREEFPAVSSRVELIQEVLRDCCTRRRSIESLEKLAEKPRAPVKPEPKPELVPAHPDNIFKIMSTHEIPKKNPVQMLQKVPMFKQDNIQQQLQTAMPGE